MQSVTPRIDTLVQRIRQEFEEAPGLQLTVNEGARFWALDVETCACVLIELQRIGFLMCTRDGRYRREATV